MAAAKSIPVYTIGAGRDGRVPMPVFDDAGRKLGYRDVLSDLDEPTLREIARLTEGPILSSDRFWNRECGFRRHRSGAEDRVRREGELANARALRVPGMARVDSGAVCVCAGTSGSSGVGAMSFFSDNCFRSVAVLLAGDPLGLLAQRCSPVGRLALHSAAERWVRGGAIAGERRVRKRLPGGVLLAVGALLVVGALARPQWGSEPEVTFDQAREVVLALDLSQSMLADDVATESARALQVTD